MPLSQALVDRARIIRKQVEMLPGSTVEGRRVEGRVRHTEEVGPWFPVRITEYEAPGTLEDGRPRVDRRPELLFSTTDEDGGAVTIRADDNVEVESDLFGSALFQVQGVPEVFRRRRSFVGGGMVHVERVDEPPDVRSGP